MRLHAVALTLGTVALWGIAPSACAQDARAEQAAEPTVSPLEITTVAPANPSGSIRLISPPGAATAAAGEAPALTLPDYVLPAVEVRALRTLSALDLPVLAWTDTETRGVHRYEADATSLRFALNLSWLNPFKMKAPAKRIQIARGYI